MVEGGSHVVSVVEGFATHSTATAAIEGTAWVPTNSYRTDPYVGS